MRSWTAHKRLVTRAGLLVLALLFLALLCSACSGRSAAPLAQAAPPLIAPANLPLTSPPRTDLALDPSSAPSGHLWASGGDVQADGTGLIIGSTDTGAAARSWVMFRQQRLLYSYEYLQSSVTPLPAQDGEPSRYWLGLSDYRQSRWDWYGPFDTADKTLVPGQDRHFSNDYGMGFISVAVEAGSRCRVENAFLRDSVTWQPGPQAVTVGPGRDFDTVTAALEFAQAYGRNEIVVYPRADNAPYEQEALLVTAPNISIIGVRTADNQRPRLAGGGFNYTGAGSVPRAIVQFNPGSDGSSLAGIELLDAHNDSFNGAGVRVNQARGIVIHDCLIHDCDMGLMSNGDAGAKTGEVLLWNCRINSNGNLADPGYNHNIYAGGYHLVMRGCEVYGSLTGHNVKSRAHINEILYCYIHDSSNREFDLVDEAGNTNLPGSDTLLLGNVIVKADPIDGNKTVIHFGQDGGGEHSGSIYLLYNTIVTPYISPVVDLSAPGAGAVIFNNIIWDAGSAQSGQAVVNARNGAALANCHGGHNWLSSGFVLADGGDWDLASTTFAAAGVSPPFVDSAAGDYHLLPVQAAGISDAGIGITQLFPSDAFFIPVFPDASYVPEFSTFQRESQGLPDIGAYEGRP